jgi:hypothetical protein
MVLPEWQGLRPCHPARPRDQLTQDPGHALTASGKSSLRARSTRDAMPVFDFRSISPERGCSAWDRTWRCSCAERSRCVESHEIGVMSPILVSEGGNEHSPVAYLRSAGIHVRRLPDLVNPSCWPLEWSPGRMVWSGPLRHPAKVDDLLVLAGSLTGPRSRAIASTGSYQPLFGSARVSAVHGSTSTRHSAGLLHIKHLVPPRLLGCVQRFAKN